MTYVPLQISCRVPLRPFDIDLQKNITERFSKTAWMLPKKVFEKFVEKFFANQIHSLKRERRRNRRIVGGGSFDQIWV